MSRTAKYEVREAEDGAGFYYVLKAANGEVLSTSETFDRREDANRAVGDALKANQEVHGFDLADD
jgi:uncharacterized protein YegP (UPF0339 family)